MKTFYNFLFLFILCLGQNLSIAQPTVTSFSPTFGPVGTAVTITGTNFNTTPANNIVFFGATQAVVNTGTATSLDVIVPVGATYQSISVTDLNSGLTAYSARPFITTFTCGGVINSSSFGPNVDSTAGYAPWGISIGDLDGDGKSDIAVANYGDNTVSVLRNTSTSGTISFAPKVDFAAGYSPWSIAIGDLDGDGKPDLAVANYSGDTAVSVLRNTSTIGTISFASKVGFATGNTPWDIAIGDLDGDGKPDLAVPNYYINTVSVFRNTSTIGTISFATDVYFTTGQYPKKVAIGDLDGDGRLEIAVANYLDNTVSALRNTGTSGTISFSTKVDFTTGTSPESITIGDLDGDGKSDLATASGDSSVSVLKNTGTSGTISFASKVDYVAGLSLKSLALSDLDGDGKLDLAVVSTSSDSVSVLRNTSTNGTISFAASVGFTIGYNSFSFVLGDLDGDGKPDLASASYSGNTVSVSKNLLGANIATMTSSNIAASCSGAAVSFPLLSDIPATYIWFASDNPNTAGESTTTQTTTMLSDIITNNTTSFQTITYIVTPTALTSSCAGSAQTLTVMVNPKPIVSSSGLDNSYCYNASVQTLTGSPVGGAFSGNGISGNTFNASVAGSGTHAITYSYTDGNTCTNTANHSTEVLPLPLSPSICMVTVDSTSTNNIIYWDKTSYTNVDSFIVYRETVSNTYKRIGSVSMDSLSLLIDTVRNLYFPFTGDPNAGTYRYKLQIRDTCGNYSALSAYHNTLYVTQTGGTFNWNDYQIEGTVTPIPELTAYYLYRDNNSSGNWSLVNGVSGSQLTINDANYATYPNASWRVETVWSISCSPTRIAVNTARSNIKGYLLSGLSSENGPAITVSIYPNPYSGNTTITYALNKKSDVSVEVYNTIGQKVETLVNTSQTAGEYKYNFSAKEKGYNAGVYFVKMIVNGNITMKRIVEME